MGGFSIWHWLILGIVIMLLFGKGRMSDLMGDMAKGIKSFKKGMADDDDEVTTTSARPTPRLQPQQPIEPVQTVELQPAKDDRPSV